MQKSTEILTAYITELNRQFQTGIAREHTYRPALQNLLASFLPHLTVSNEPARQACGAPDFILQRKENNIPIAFVEAKDINDSDLIGKSKNKEQFDRYKRSLDNLILTDYLDFLLYEKGEFVDSIRIAELKGEKIIAIKENFEKFEHLIKRFGNAQPQKIVSSAKLAEIMAGKARLLANVIENTITEDSENSVLEGQMKAFKEVLIHDITPKEFADVYAQTITYGMFSARLHDDKPDTFCREKTAKLIPKTNPFLRQLFQSIAVFDLDERISWIVDDLAETFRATDMFAVMKGFGKRTQQTDPMIHFYENFLSAYDPALRKSRGVWYTPQSIVNFIVRAVDEILQTEFGLLQGLADTSKTKIKVANQTTTKSGKIGTSEIEVHKVQILDPATGTGTFLAETVSQIYEKFSGQSGLWQSYVEQHLIPRLNGFELLMASYTMAHLKLDLLLTETGYKSTNDKRLNVYLTNSLEEYHKETGTLFAQFLAREANEANRIKRDTPVMVVLGNPPYSGISSNNGEWISRLIDDYKYVNGEHFNERKHWLNDDYVKFIRLGQEFVDRNSEGVFAYINNHSFIDNPTFRGMRWNLMKSFDKIFIIDLHGNNKKKEVCPDGSKDENVFDIQQGVSINIFVKTGSKTKKDLAEVYHFDLYGKRKEKYDYLLNNNFSNIPFVRVEPTAPFYFLMPKNEENRSEYEQGFSVTELLQHSVTGALTGNDNVLMATSKEILQRQIESSYSTEINESHLKGLAYRPFDSRHMYYVQSATESKIKLPAPYRSRYKIMRNFLKGDNYGLIVGRQGQVVGNMPWNLVFLTQDISDLNMFYRGGGMTFPLYLYPDQAELENTTRTPNLAPKILEKLSKSIKLEFESEKSNDITKFAPIDVLDYIYAVLHSPAYREKYKEFLKIDFPRVPYPKNAKEFWKLVELGGNLRRLHLLEGVEPQTDIANFPVEGTMEIGKPQFVAGVSTPPNDRNGGRVYINDTQYFDNVPQEAWEFYIGGYQPAQKWLKDRKGRTLSFDDIRHYQRIVRVLKETGEVMGKID